MIIVREGEPVKHMTGHSLAIVPTAEGAGFVKTGLFSTSGILFLLLNPDFQLGGSQPSSAFLFWQFLPRAWYSQVAISSSSSRGGEGQAKVCTTLQGECCLSAFSHYHHYHHHHHHHNNSADQACWAQDEPVHGVPVDSKRRPASLYWTRSQQGKGKMMILNGDYAKVNSTKIFQCWN